MSGTKTKQKSIASSGKEIKAEDYKLAKLPGPFSLVASSWKQYVAHWKWFVMITAAIVIPVTVLLNLSGNDPVLNAYFSLPMLLMNLALIWAVMETEAGRPAKTADAYYRGTGQIVSFMLVTLILTLQLLPFVIGAAIYANITGGGTVSATPAENWIAGGLWLLLALPTVFWLVGSLFAIFAVQDPEVRPFMALRISRKAVKGHRPAVAGRLLFAAIILIILLAVPSLALAFLPVSGWVRWGSSALAVLSSIVILPLAYIYALRLYRAL